MREFYQCDIDVIGTRSLLVEAEVARIIVDVFTSLGIPDFRIKLNSRRLMNEVLEKFGVGDKRSSIIRAIDKLDKIGFAAVVQELQSEGLTEAEKLMALLAPADNVEETLQKFQAFDTSEIEEVLRKSKELGVGEAYFEFDPSLARGLDYYTGIIFEVVSRAADFGTLCAGGRYDDLTGLFLTTAPKGEETSGMGVAFGFERIMLVMEELGLLTDIKSGSKVLVTQFPGMEAEALDLYRRLIEARVAAEIYLEPSKIDKQLKFANKKGIPFALMVGSDEVKAGAVALKDLTTGEERRLPLQEAIEALR